MKVHTEYEQGSLEWMVARLGIPTASEFSSLVTPKWKIKAGDGPITYLCTKLAEAWTQHPLREFSSFATEQGSFREDDAIPWYAFEYGVEIQRVGFVTTDDGRIGCSPDGMFEDGTGIEVKCPAPHTHVGYLLGGGLPEQYLAQVHGCMFVTGASEWKFLSYCPRFPALVLTVKRDEEIQAVLRIALDGFLKTFDAQWERLVEKNGGPPKKRKQFVPSPQEHGHDPDDIIP